MDEKYTENLLRIIASLQYTQVVHTVAKDMFGKAFHVLSQEERNAVFSTVNNMVGAQMNFLTPDLLLKTVDQHAPTLGGFPGQQSVAPKS